MATRIKPKQIAAGAENQVLGISNGVPAWVDKDIIYPVDSAVETYYKYGTDSQNITRVAVGNLTDIKQLNYRWTIPSRFIGKKVKFTIAFAPDIELDNKYANIRVSIHQGSRQILPGSDYSIRGWHVHPFVYSIIDTPTTNQVEVRIIDRDKVLHSNGFLHGKAWIIIELAERYLTNPAGGGGAAPTVPSGYTPTNGGWQVKTVDGKRTWKKSVDIADTTNMATQTTRNITITQFPTGITKTSNIAIECTSSIVANGSFSTSIAPIGVNLAASSNTDLQYSFFNFRAGNSTIGTRRYSIKITEL